MSSDRVARQFNSGDERFECRERPSPSSFRARSKHWANVYYNPRLTSYSVLLYWARGRQRHVDGIHVLSNKRLTAVAWQSTIDSEGFNLKLDPEVRLESASGFPAILHANQSGFECFHDEVSELVETYAETSALDFRRH